MKNIPRIYIDQKLEVGKQIPLPKDVVHYLQRVMRTDTCLVFNNGSEFVANLIPDSSLLVANSKTEHTDPSNDITFCFAPIKKTDELLNMATQMGVAKLQPVITDRTVAHHINWDRMRKIIIEASEQSNRNSIPELLPPIKFSELNKTGLTFADERAAHGRDIPSPIAHRPSSVFVGPEGGFSDTEFSALDSGGAIGIGLGKTILRAEVAAVALLAKIIK